METVRDVIKRLAETTSSSEDDGRLIEKFLPLLGYNNARVVCGVVYMEGSGNPISIHSTAKMILDVVEKLEVKKRLGE